MSDFSDSFESCQKVMCNTNPKLTDRKTFLKWSKANHPDKCVEEFDNDDEIEKCKEDRHVIFGRASPCAQKSYFCGSSNNDNYNNDNNNEDYDSDNFDNNYNFAKFDSNDFRAIIQDILDFAPMPFINEREPFLRSKIDDKRKKSKQSLKLKWNYYTIGRELPKNIDLKLIKDLVSLISEMKDTGPTAIKLENAIDILYKVRPILVPHNITFLIIILGLFYDFLLDKGGLAGRGEYPEDIQRLYNKIFSFLPQNYNNDHRDEEIYDIRDSIIQMPTLNEKRQAIIKWSTISDHLKTYEYDDFNLSPYIDDIILEIPKSNLNYTDNLNKLLNKTTSTEYSIISMLNLISDFLQKKHYEEYKDTIIVQLKQQLYLVQKILKDNLNITSKVSVKFMEEPLISDPNTLKIYIYNLSDKDRLKKIYAINGELFDLPVFIMDNMILAHSGYTDIITKLAEVLKAKIVLLV